MTVQRLDKRHAIFNILEVKMCSIEEYLGENARKWPDRAAVVCGGRNLNYADLDRESDCLADSLRALGIKKNDRLAMLMQNCIDWLLLWYACQKLGAVAVPLHTKLLESELVNTLSLAEARALFFSPEFAEKALFAKEKCLRTLLLVQTGSEAPAGCLAMEALPSEPKTAREKLYGEDGGVILFTSGTTGVSKGVPRNREILAEYARQLGAEARVGDSPPVMLTPAPLYHAAGLCCVVKTLVLGGTLVLTMGFDPEEICQLIETMHATQLALVPPRLYQRLRESGAAGKYDLGSVRLVHLTAGRTSEECVQDIFAMFPNTSLRTTWGSTETSNVTVAILSRKQLEKKPGLIHTVGQVNSVAEIKLVDAEGHVLSRSGVGEAYVRSPLVFHGYLNAPEQTKRCFDNGWFKTEDIVRCDEDGYYYLMGRKRDIIKTGGENVYAQEVEHVIMSHPAVKDCAVVGIPDHRFEEAVAAAIVLKPGAALGAQELMGFCKRYMPSYKKPRYWAVMDRLPENELGKVQKNILRHEASALFSRIC